MAGPPPTPLPALGISMVALWMGGASGDAYLAVTLATGCAPPPLLLIGVCGVHVGVPTIVRIGIHPLARGMGPQRWQTFQVT